MTATERRKAIWDKLRVRKSDTRNNLAFEFGVSLPTIDRDILALSMDYPIYTLQGKGGGIYVEDWYHERNKYLSVEQLDVLHRLMSRANCKDANIIKSIIADFSRT